MYNPALNSVRYLFVNLFMFFLFCDRRFFNTPQGLCSVQMFPQFTQPLSLPIFVDKKLDLVYGGYMPASHLTTRD